MATSLRGLWIIRLSNKPETSQAAECKGVLFKRFGTVESGVRGAHGAAYVPIVTDMNEFCRLFADAVAPRISSSAHSYIEGNGEGKCEKKRCEMEDEVVPLRKVCALSTGLWPLCWIERDNVYHIALPAVSKYSFERKLTSDEL